VGKHCLIMFFSGLFYLLALVLLESGLLYRWRSKAALIAPAANSKANGKQGGVCECVCVCVCVSQPCDTDIWAYVQFWTRTWRRKRSACCSPTATTSSRRRTSSRCGKLLWKVTPLVCSHSFCLQTFRKENGDYHTAVNHLSFGVTPAEIFGLLGINGVCWLVIHSSLLCRRSWCRGGETISGAGKSTTFRMLTGEEVPTEGEVNIFGFNTATNMAEARRHIGYCPQYDGLIREL
jgi:hypothetical protein